MDQLARRLDAVADGCSQLSTELGLLPAPATLDFPGRLGRLSAQLAAGSDAARLARQGEAARCAQQLVELATAVRVAAGNYRGVDSPVESGLESRFPAGLQAGPQGRVQP